MNLRNDIFLIVISLLFLNSCGKEDLNNPALNQNLAGCWVGGLMRNGHLTEDIQLRLFEVNADSTLTLRLIFELGPRSRVWEYDTEISCQNREINWLAHDGHLSENLDTMYLTKRWKGEVSQWMFYRDKSYDDYITRFLSNRSDKYTYTIPAGLEDNLHCASLQAVGIDSSIIRGFIRKILAGENGDIHSMLIYRDGKLVLEEYFALNGQISGAFINETYRAKTHQLSSVTKGILSLATGISIEKGHISDVYEPIVNHLPNYSSYFSDDEKQIQINHLLTMTAGWKWNQFNYPWNDNRNDAGNMYKCDDVVEYILERPLTARPGAEFNYTNGEPTLLGVILRNACGMEVDKFSDLHLFEPLGIKEYQWTRYPDGSLETDGGLKLCSRDLLKIGLLMLRNGIWQGKQIISEDWISESTISRRKLSVNRGYGYYWNTMKFNFRGKAEYAIFVPGSGGQFLAVFPSLDMVIAFTAGTYEKDATKMYWAIIKNNILPAITN